MTDKIFSKLNIYDQIGYLLVGGLAILVGLIDCRILGFHREIVALTADNFVIWFLVAYFLGHLIHAVANTLVKENKTVFSESEKEILAKARLFFDGAKQSDNEVYLLCYMLSSAKDITGQVQSFNAYYSLYRGWFTIFLFEMNFVSLVILAHGLSLKLLTFFTAASVISFLMLTRSRRFYDYSRGKTLQTFTLIEKLKL